MTAAWVIAIVIVLAEVGYCFVATLSYLDGCSPFNPACWSREAARPNFALLPEANLSPGTVQNYTVRIGADSVRVTMPVRLSRDDRVVQKYLDGRITLAALAFSAGDLIVDGQPMAFAPNLRRTKLRVTSKLLAADLEATLGGLPLSAIVHGEHSVRWQGRQFAAVRVLLTDVAFARSDAFDPPPSSVAGLDDGRWNILNPDAMLRVRVELTSAASPAQRLRSFFDAVSRASGFPNIATQLAFALWPVAAISLTLRSMRRSNRPLLRDRIDVLISGAIAAGFGYTFVEMMYLVRRFEIVRMLPELLVAAVVWLFACVAATICLLAVIGAVRARNVMPVRIVICVMAMFGIAMAFEIARSIQAFAAFAQALSPVVAFITGSVVLLIVLQPKPLVRYALGKRRAFPYVRAGIVAVAVLGSALCRVVPVSTFHQEASVSAVGAVLGAGFNVVTLSMPIAGLLLFVCAGGLSLAAPRSMSWWTIIIFISIWCVGFEPAILTIPVPALLALVTVPLVALRSDAECSAIARAKVTSIGDLFYIAMRRTDVDAARRTVRRLQDKFLNSDIDAVKLRTQSNELEQFALYHEAEFKRTDPENIASSLFTSFPMVAPLAAARRASIVGAIIGIVTFAVGFPDLLRTSLDLAQPLLWLSAAAVQTVARSAVAAFVFVLFLPYFRGSAATTKGVLLGIAALLAALPSVLTAELPKQGLFDAASAALFFPVVGAAFDVMALRHHATELSLARVFGLAGLGNYAAIGTVLLSAIATAVTGQLQHVAGSLVSGAFPVPTSIADQPRKP